MIIAHVLKMLAVCYWCNVFPENPFSKWSILNLLINIKQTDFGNLRSSYPKVALGQISQTGYVSSCLLADFRLSDATVENLNLMRLFRSADCSLGC